MVNAIANEVGHRRIVRADVHLVLVGAGVQIVGVRDRAVQRLEGVGLVRGLAVHRVEALEECEAPLEGVEL